MGDNGCQRVPMVPAAAGKPSGRGLQTADGPVTYCIFNAPEERRVREHAAAAGMPCDRVMEIQTLGPQDFD